MTNAPKSIAPYSTRAGSSTCTARVLAKGRILPKPQIALDLVDRALANGVRVQAWTFDELYGRDSAFLDGLEQRGQIFVAEVTTNFRAWMKKPRVLRRGKS